MCDLGLREAVGSQFLFQRCKGVIDGSAGSRASEEERKECEGEQP